MRAQMNFSNPTTAHLDRNHDDEALLHVHGTGLCEILRLCAAAAGAWVAGNHDGSDSCELGGGDGERGTGR